MGKKLEAYLKIPFEEKNRREKFKSIQDEWKIPVSPLEERNWLSWFRWRR